MIEQAEMEALRRVAEQMVLAARTAPKGRGLDNLKIVILESEEIQALADEMECLGNAHQLSSFLRDARTIRENAALALLLGTRLQVLGLKFCGLCGYPDCASNQAAHGICVFNPGDLGIAIGSAVAVAARHHADNRIMYTMGMAALSLKLLGEDIRLAYGIPLAAKGKNPFFDRT